MPTWAIVGFTAVVYAVSSVVVTLEAIWQSQDHHWTLGQSTLAISFANLALVALLMTVLASILRFKERRNR